MTRLGDVLPDLGRKLLEVAAQRREEAAARGVACLVCDDTGEVRREEAGRQLFLGWCHCAAGRAREIAAREGVFRAGLDVALSIPERYRGLDLDTFPDQRSAALARVRRWLAERGPSDGLYLGGPFGRGKTVLAVACLRALALAAAAAAESPYGVSAARLGRFVAVTDFLESLRPGEASERVAMHAYQRVRYLVLDDLGSERLTEWGADRLFEVINDRHGHLRPTLVTSNLTPKALAERWNAQVALAGDRILQRVLEGMTAVMFAASEPNWRERKGDR